MEKTTLVIMAAGMGSRYGGIKQIEPVGPSGEIILDYSVYDALQAGFDKVIIIIRKDIEEDFRNVVGNKLEKHVNVEYVFQELSDLPDGFSVPQGRIKPWGTGHAILACRKKIDTPFIVINADDYYGREGFAAIHDFLCNPKAVETPYNFCMAGFRLENTLSEHGTVTRGVCNVEDGKLVDVEETFEIKRGGTCAISPLRTIPFDQPVSMNMWGFTPDLLKVLEERFIDFLEKAYENPLKCEYLLPTIIDQMVKENLATVHVLDTRDKWFGVTYKEDKEYVVSSIRKLVEDGAYPATLFD